MLDVATQLPLTLLRVDGGTQPRSVIDDAVVQDYATAMTDGATFPPVTVFYDGTAYWLADGFHRYHATHQCQYTTIDVDVRQGTRRDAVLYSVGANATHGLRRTNADKRRAVETLLSDSEWVGWSDNQIAKQCGVNQSTVSRIRQENPSYALHKMENPSRLVERNGTVYTQNTANIGRSQVQTSEPDGKQEASVSTGHGIAELYSRSQGSPALYTIPTDEEEETYQWRYNPETHEAYCKYCYETHRLWDIFDDVFPGDHVWACRICRHRTKDEFMQIDASVTIRNYEDSTVLPTVEHENSVLDEHPLEVQPEEDIKDKRDLHVMRVMGSSDSPEWYTPQEIVQLSIDLLGEIDLDPCSNSYETPNVPAHTLYTKEHDGLLQPWSGRTYLNPPYGSEIPQWVNKLVEAHTQGDVTEAIALLPARIDTLWFQPLYAFPMCNVRGRIQYENSPYSAPFPCVIVYLGERLDDFIKVFGGRGPIMKRIG